VALSALFNNRLQIAIGRICEVIIVVLKTRQNTAKLETIYLAFRMIRNKKLKKVPVNAFADLGSET